MLPKRFVAKNHVQMSLKTVIKTCESKISVTSATECQSCIPLIQNIVIQWHTDLCMYYIEEGDEPLSVVSL